MVPREISIPVLSLRAGGKDIGATRSFVTRIYTRRFPFDLHCLLILKEGGKQGTNRRQFKFRLRSFGSTVKDRFSSLLFREYFPRLFFYSCFSIYNEQSIRGLFLGQISPPPSRYSLAPAHVASCLVTLAMKIDRFVSIFVSAPFSRHTIGGNTNTYYGGNIVNVYLYGRVESVLLLGKVVKVLRTLSLVIFFFFLFRYRLYRVSFTYRWKNELRRLLLLFLLREKLNRFFFKSLHVCTSKDITFLPFFLSTLSYYFEIYFLSQFSLPLENTKKEERKRKRKLKRGIL